jgi:hypothetical protein
MAERWLNPLAVLTVEMEIIRALPGFDNQLRNYTSDVTVADADDKGMGRKLYRKLGKHVMITTGNG